MQHSLEIYFSTFLLPHIAPLVQPPFFLFFWAMSLPLTDGRSTPQGYCVINTPLSNPHTPFSLSLSLSHTHTRFPLCCALQAGQI